MKATFPRALTYWPIQIGKLEISLAKVLPNIALAGIIALAAVLRFANLAALGYANQYYTAAVASMLQSWHNFFFVAAEPGGSVSVDKPPVGFWLQTASAHIFGVTTFGILLPEILAGILSVIVLYHLVQRSFGTPAGLLAALALAITPVAVATDRNNTIDSILVFTLLLAAWAFIKATETAKLKYLLLAVTIVGIGFNVKMMEAFLPLPAFYALYFLGAKERMWSKVPKLALATVVLTIVSLSWATIVDLTPADQRPWVGSTSDNSELSLAIGYNGVERLLGRGGRGGLLDGVLGGLSGDLGGANRGFATPGPNGAPPRSADGRSLSSGPATPGGFGAFFDGDSGAQGSFVGFGDNGQAGPLRLFIPPLSNEVSWLLPFGLFGAALVAFRNRLRWPLTPNHQAIVLWGGWLVTTAVFFSVAGFFQQYYLTTMGPPLAALVGIGAVALWQLYPQHHRLATILLFVAAGGTLASQLFTARAFVGNAWWLAIGLVLFIIGLALLVIPASRRYQHAAMVGFVVVTVALLVTPGVWAALTMLHSTSPAAYSGRSSVPANGGGLQIDQALLNYVEANTQGAKYLMAVPSAMQGDGYVIATGRPVLYMGGFSGQDPVVTADDLTQMASDGELRYIYASSNGRGGFGGGQPDIAAWISANCVPVPGFDTLNSNSGAPNGAGARSSAWPGYGSRNIQGTLYQYVGAS